ncbi:MAG: DUF6324 family protein [Pseudomonadota bacterium]
MSGINRQTDDEGEVTIGPTDQGMVRIYVKSEAVNLPMDFLPEEAREMAEELLAAAEQADRDARRQRRSGDGDAPARRPGGRQK